MCAITAAKRKKSILILEKSNKVGKKILMSGGGRCNFTNLFVEADYFLSKNPHFCKSALKKYTPYDFIAMVEKHNINYVEKNHHELFCEKSSKDILNMLLEECHEMNVAIETHTDVKEVSNIENKESLFSYQLRIMTNSTHENIVQCKSLVVATGALSIPKLGGSGFGYELAQQFNLPLVSRRASLVPFMFTGEIKNLCENLSGISLPVDIESNNKVFEESMLFTHRGLSGPAILQISNYWDLGGEITINLLPNINAAEALLSQKQKKKKVTIKKYLTTLLPKALVTNLEALWWYSLKDQVFLEISDDDLTKLGSKLNAWKIKPAATEGYRTAEVTLGGIDTDAIESKTMEIKNQPGLFFIGEVLDVTGHLGGYNFQWAWASGYSAGLVA
tara:strand:+ start:457 stop:1626 length:1170 start_codon:yes stop_codon:yes gene_type:complete